MVKNEIIYLLIVVFVFQWMIELNLVKIEIENNFKKISRLFFINIIVILLIIISSFLFDFEYFKEILLAYVLYLFYFYINTVDFKKIRFDSKFLKELNFLFQHSIKSYSFFSSFFLNFANLVWRVLVVFFVGKNVASIIFFFYAIGSFPASIFNSSFGPTMVKNKISLNKLYLFFALYLSAIITLIYFTFFIFDIVSINMNSILTKNFIINISVFSLIGSLLMLCSMHFRQVIINNNPNFNNKVFLRDIHVSFGIILIIPILFYSGGLNHLAFSYFFASLISIISYSLINIK